MAVVKVLVLAVAVMFPSIIMGNIGESYSKDKVSMEAELEMVVDMLEKEEISRRASELKMQQMIDEQAAEILQLSGQLREEDDLISHLRQEKTLKASYPRTCEELLTANPSTPSGYQMIDPDGPSSDSEEPFTAFCNMTTGTTEVPHNSEIGVVIDKCAPAGCYSRSVAYNATMKQIVALTKLSGTCRQFIRFNCVGIPFQFNGLDYAWWNGRDSNQNRTYWAGSDVSKHTCQCGLDANCTDTSVFCNCDSLAPEAVVDAGYITNVEDLPVTTLRFGRASSTSSFGLHTLGRMECFGRPTIDGPPMSCADLWILSYSLNGIYTVQGDNGVKTVYCDFSKLPGDAGQEILIGYSDVKTTEVYFNAARDSDFTTTDSAIPFEKVRFNKGSAFNMNTGLFRPPTPGLYFFSFIGSGNDAKVALLKNEQVIGTAKTTGAQIQISLSSTIELKPEDSVAVKLLSGSLLDNAADHLTVFSGFLLTTNIE